MITIFFVMISTECFEKSGCRIFPGADDNQYL